MEQTENAKEMNNKNVTTEKYRQRLEAIQWITHNQRFNEHQWIQLGDAIAAFSDCIDEVSKLKEQLAYTEMLHDQAQKVIERRNRQVKVLRDGLEFYGDRSHYKGTDLNKQDFNTSISESRDSVDKSFYIGGKKAREALEKFKEMK